MSGTSFIITGNKTTFSRIKSLSEHFSKVTASDAKKFTVTVEENPTGYFKQKLDSLGATVRREYKYDGYDDPYHNPPYYC
ncbi:MAG: hypothetical protein EP349_02710 [Alphaproteobacteria bacterium]|nr:MAG: hypothetical protein EP349_02710 [Alphaproteobacteria bacterium]